MPRSVLLLALAALAACSSGERAFEVGPPRLADARAAPGSIAFEDSVHALVVFVRFQDDTADLPEWDVEGAHGLEVVPEWGLDLFKENPADVTAAMGLSDPSLSAYFFWQSQGGPGRAHIVTGEVWPRHRGRPHVFTPSRPSTGYAAGRGRGYGYLVQEVLDDLVGEPGFDFGRFDANRDGELDHLMLIVRRDPAVPVIGGVAALEGVTNARVRTRGAPPSLAYPSSRGEVSVDLGSFGSGTINWVGGEHSVRTLAHEYGHILLDQGHTTMIEPGGRGPVSNDVPFDVPSGTGAFACQYSRMCGGGSGRGRPSESSNYDGNLTLSGFELRRLGWADRTVLEDADTTVTLDPLFGSGDVVLIPLRPGSAGDTLSLESRHRTNAFDAFPPLDYDDPFYGLVYRDLPTEGLLVTLSHGDPAGPASRYRYDFVPPSNRLVQAGSRCDGASEGCASPYGPWDGDMLRSGGATQLSPWTRPNVSGYTFYPDGAEPNWFAVTAVRYTGRDRELAFDFDADVRTGAFEVAVDSWMGAETSGTRFSDPVRVLEGVTLRVWQGAEVAFDGGLEVAPGGRFVCEVEARCTVGGKRVLEVE